MTFRSLKIKINLRDSSASSTVDGMAYVVGNFFEIDVERWTTDMAAALLPDVPLEEVSGMALFKSALEVAETICKRLSNGGLFVYGHCQGVCINDDDPVGGYSKIVIDATGTADERLNAQIPLVHAFAEFFPGARVLLDERDEGNIKSTLFAHGSNDGRPPALGDGSDLKFDVDIFDNQGMTSLSKTVSIVEIDEMVAAMSRIDQSTPGGRADCARAVLRSLVTRAVAGTGAKVLTLALDDRTYKSPDPRVYAFCEIQTNTQQTVNDVANALSKAIDEFSA